MKKGAPALPASRAQHDFSRIFLDHRDAVLRICRVYADDCWGAEDLFQEVALAVWQSLDSFRGDSAPKTWVYRIALNVCLKRNRRKKSERRLLEGLRVHWRDVDGAEDRQRQRRLERLYRYIGELDDLDKSLMILYLDRFSGKEIAAVTGLSESNAAVRIHRLKAGLARRFHEEERHG